jgi:sialic acid synthase SpsE
MTKIISECGINWSGDLMTARDMIILSARAGADFVKFQLFNKETIKGNKYDHDTFYHDILSQMILNEEFIQYLSDTAKQNDIGFGISVMYKEGFDLLNTLNAHTIQFIKIRYADRNNPEIAEQAIKYCTENRTELLISCDDPNYTKVYSHYPANYLYCVPKYPPELSEIDEKCISKFLFNGYSNHYPSKYLPMLAVSRGIELIEIHVKRKTHNKVAMDEGLVLPQLDEKVSINFDNLEDVCKFRDIISELTMR